MPRCRVLLFSCLPGILAIGACSVSETSCVSPAAWKNSLGMAFVEVPVDHGVILMACEETQERHLTAFRSTVSIPTAGLERPATQVSWREASAFCTWLTKHERAAGVIDVHQRYRLPTDHEWSCAAGIGHLEARALSPEAKSNQIPDHYPWGTTWPPPRGAGNLCGSESKADFPDHFIHDYRDAFSGGGLRARASQPNALGLYDLSGNVWEWCADRFRNGTDWRVLRGGSWKSVRPQTLLSSHRTHDPEGYRSDSVGFRCVLARDP